MRIGDEVHLVTAGGEFDAKLGGHDAAAAVGRIAGDADLHGLHPFAFLKAVVDWTRRRRATIQLVNSP